MIPELITLDDITHWAPMGSCRRLLMLRLDTVHPVVSGNKWFKLRYHIEAAIAGGKKVLLTFGGGFSNHLVATAYAARESGLESIGMVRGHYEGEYLSHTLNACLEYGMQLVPLSKEQYAVLARASEDLKVKYPEALIIPEGGANDLGIRGAAGIATLIPEGVSAVCVPVGTGTTLAGLLNALPGETELHGFCAARNCDQASSLIAASETGNTTIIHAVDDPRFGKWTDDLLQFMRHFFHITGIQLDVVYTGKMMMKMAAMLAHGDFEKDSTIVCIHTGGLQGNPPLLFGE